MKIKILAETKQEKGKSFEKLMGMILDKIGCTNFQFNTHDVGMELDIQAQHKVSNQPILCECKAHEEKIGTGDLTTFYGKFNHKRGENQNLNGMFFSTSGFTGTAIEWYKGVPKEDSDVFKIFGNDEIIKLLIENKFLISEENFGEIIKRQITHKLDERYLVFFESQIYIIQIFKINDSEKRYVIYDGEGNLVKRTIYEQIAKLDEEIKSIPLIDLEILNKVILNLLDLESKTVKDVALGIVESEKNVNIIFDDLLAEGIIEKNESEYKIKTDLEILKKLSNRFCRSKDKFSFMQSKYIDFIINDEFVSLVAKHFRINFDESQKIAIKRASVIFPEILYFLLLSDVSRYTNFADHRERIEKGKKPNEQFDIDILSSFMSDFSIIIINELYKIPTNYISKKGIEGYFISTDLRIASEEKLFFILDSGGTHVIQKVGKGPIKDGEILVASDMSVILRSATIQLMLELTDHAIRDYDRVIGGTSNQEWIKAAWTNKGFAYIIKKEYDEADKCFNEALKIEPGLQHAINGLKKSKELRKVNPEKDEQK